MKLTHILTNKDDHVIKPNAATPMYVQIYERLRSQILSGEIKEEEKLPSEKELGLLCNASRITIRQALDLLMKDDLVFTAQGKGTFVKRRPVQLDLMQIVSFDKTLQEKGIVGSTILLDFTRNVRGKQLERLAAVGHWNSACRLELIGRISGKPAVYYRSYVREDIGEKIYPLARDQAERKQIFSAFSLYAEIGYRISRINQEIFAVEADAFLGKVLGVPVGKALLKMESLAYDKDEILIEYKTAYYRADKYSLSLVRRSGPGQSWS